MRRSLVVCLLLAGCVTTETPAASYLDRLILQFETIAFNTEYGPQRNQFDRWVGKPVLIRLTNGHDQRALIERVAAEVAAMSGLEVRLANPGESANTVVTFTANFCEVRGTPGQPARIQIGYHNLLGCAREELYQLLALDNDACVVPSILCDSNQKEFTDADRLLMRAAFDPRLKVGMTKAEGMPIARQIIRELYEAWPRAQ